MYQDLGIGMIGGETVAAFLQVGAEMLVIIDFAIEDELDLAVFVAHRLAASGQVNDGKTTKGQSDLAA